MKMIFRLKSGMGSACILACFALMSAQAQQSAPSKSDSQKNRRAQSTHDFLGLGAVPDAAAAERGQKLFASNCSFCHGIKATGGDTGPDLVRSSLVLHDQKGELIGQVVHNGRPNKGMPAFASLTDAQIYDIAEFLHMRVEDTANRGTYKLENVLTGDPKAGEAYFKGPGKCDTCHSVTGDLAHIGSKLSPGDLQQAFLYPGARGYEPGKHEKVQKVKVTLPTGQTISGELKRLDDFNVSLYDESGDYHSIPRGPETKVTLDDPLAAHRELLGKYTDADMHNLTAYLATLK